MLEKQFLNDVVLPWDKLNALLAKPFAYEPQISQVTTNANSIAVAIKHTAELFEADRKNTDLKSQPNSLMSDVADSWKHGSTKLRIPSRQCNILVRSRFEISPSNQVRFVRNRIVVSHRTLGELDFMTNARDAIRYWLKERAININWAGRILEGPQIFREAAVVYFDPTQQLGMGQWAMETVKRAEDESLQLFDPESLSFKIEVFDDNSFNDLGQPNFGTE